MVYKWAEWYINRLNKQDKQFINWLNGLQAGLTVYKLAKQLIPRTNGRSCTSGLNGFQC